MTYTNPATPVTLTPITVTFYNVNIRDNIIHLRGILPDPGSANLALISLGGTTAAFGLVPDAALALPKVQAATDIVASFAALIAANKNGFHEVVTATDGPVAGQTYYCISTVEGNQPATYGWQMAMSIADQNELYTRVIIAGVAGAWQRIWTAGNDGGSSTLDAGLFNGQLPAFYATAASVAAVNQVPSGLGGFFATAAGIAAGWTRYTAADGRLLVGAGTTFTQTFTENTAVGANWTPFAGSSVFSLTAADVTGPAAGGSAFSAPSHTHQVTMSAQTWTPVARVVCWATKN